MKKFEEFFMAKRGPILFLVFMIAVVGSLAGFKYYKYTQEQPEFCSSCHLMEEAVKSWQRSSHKLYQCQICHKMSMIEQNKLLIAFVANPKGKIEQKHGRIAPWTVCKDCHTDTVGQGSISVSKSYGHAKHVFMQGISCDRCHRGELHSFRVTRDACLNCHSDKLVHGMGTEGLNCLNCHNYAENSPRMVTPARCLKCHQPLPKNAPMAKLNCFECHKPHTKMRMESADCLGRCHGNESKVGQHGLHMKKTKLGCMDCHKPHTWVIGKVQAKGLCDRCHPLKDPVRFLY
ncbi:MAG: NapC/NirT family cytochrome c [bacterium]